MLPDWSSTWTWSFHQRALSFVSYSYQRIEPRALVSTNRLTRQENSLKIILLSDSNAFPLALHRVFLLVYGSNLLTPIWPFMMDIYCRPMVSLGTHVWPTTIYQTISRVWIILMMGIFVKPILSTDHCQASSVSCTGSAATAASSFVSTSASWAYSHMQCSPGRKAFRSFKCVFTTNANLIAMKQSP